MFRLTSMIDIDEGFYKVPTLSTAGAVTVKDEKGRLVTQKVKVHRYVAGKRPEYAQGSSGEEEADEAEQQNIYRQEMSDRRLKRLEERELDLHGGENDRIARHRADMDPNVLADDDYIERKEEIEEYKYVEDYSDDEGQEMELSDDEIARRRTYLKQQLKQREDEELLEREEEVLMSEGESGNESIYTTDESSDIEDAAAPRMKPVFVMKKDRITKQERENENQKLQQKELEARKQAEERRRQTIKMVEDEIRKEKQMEREAENLILACDFDTDDENDEAAYEKWKLRELKRLKREKDERDLKERERIEIENNRMLAEEGRLAELRSVPRVVVNKEPKGKYKFLQKYYHRGAFFLDKEDPVYKRDFSAPTLEDHFDKTILPKVMQVKNFGMAGRTKYTHLVDQDTTSFDSPWTADKAQTLRWHNSKGGGMKQIFDRPSGRKKKTVA